MSLSSAVLRSAGACAGLADRGRPYGPLNAAKLTSRNLVGGKVGAHMNKNNNNNNYDKTCLF